MKEPNCIVVAWVENDGTEPTGRLIWVGSHHVPEYRSAPRAVAAVWSRNLDDFERAEAYAKTVGGFALVMEDTDDVLDRARVKVLKVCP